VKAVVASLGLTAAQYSVAYQSRLGRAPWLQPYTDAEVLRLARSGVRRLVVVCPAFVSDCLETLEEIGLRARADFHAAGGGQLVAVPCLNDHPTWLHALERMARAFLQAGPD